MSIVDFVWSLIQFCIHGKWPTWCTILFYVFISILYVFRETLCLSSGESIVSIRPLVYVTLCRWPFRVQVGNELFLSDQHMKPSQIQSDIHEMLYWYNWFSWWWARGCSKHVENWNKYEYTENNCALIWSFTMYHNRMQHQQNIKLYILQFNILFNNTTGLSHLKTVR